MGVGTKNLHLKKHKKLPQTLTEVRRGILRNTGSPSPAPNFKIAGKVKTPLFRLPRAFPAAAPGLETAGGTRLSGKQAPVPTLAPPERAKGPRAGLGPSPGLSDHTQPARCESPRRRPPTLGVCPPFTLDVASSDALRAVQTRSAPPTQPDSAFPSQSLVRLGPADAPLKHQGCPHTDGPFPAAIHLHKPGLRPRLALQGPPGRSAQALWSPRRPRPLDRG